MHAELGKGPGKEYQGSSSLIIDRSPISGIQVTLASVTGKTRSILPHPYPSDRPPSRFLPANVPS